jgi:hypothetical protein
VNVDSQAFIIRSNCIEIRDLFSDKDQTGSLPIRKDPAIGFYIADVPIKEFKPVQERFRRHDMSSRL